MKPQTVLGIYREQIFSPGKIRDDANILDATLEELSRQGWGVEAIQGESLDPLFARPTYVLSMAQSSRVLGILEDWAKHGTRIVNSVSSIRNCYRTPLTRLLMNGGIAIPASQMVPLEAARKKIVFNGTTRFWLKRGDVHAIQEADVSCVTSQNELKDALDHFRKSGIRQILVQKHVEGPVVKFYAVGQNSYFRAFLASSGEDITPHMGELHGLARKAARAVGLEVYGGDAILVDNNGVVLIDLNDWPSFSRCCQTASKSIATHFVGKVLAADIRTSPEFLMCSYT